MAWKSPKTQYTVAGVLTEIWVKQEQNEIELPLFYDEKELESPKRQRMDFKEKIYHMFRLMNFDDNLCSSLKTVQQKAAILKIKEHDKLLMDEVWQDIEKKLDKECVRPTTPDQELLKRKADEAANRLNDIQTNIQKLDDEENNKLIEIERSFYETLHERKRVNEQKLSKKKITVMEAKMQKMKMVQSSLQAPDESSMRSTSLSNTHELV